MGHFLIMPLSHSVSEMTARKWWWWWRWWGWRLFFYISPKLSDADTMVLKRTDQETSHDGPDSISRAVHTGITCYVVRGLVRGRALTCLKMIDELRTINSGSISAYSVFVTDAKPNL
jgi:hypothetical protein